MPAATKQPQQGTNGNGNGDPIAEAIAYEQAIADEAAEIRGDDAELTPALFLRLWPLLKRPIPTAFIQTVGKVEGKPYESTGIRSVQVQIDRMNNVLTPLWWWDEVRYEEDGKLAEVTVYVGQPGAFGEERMFTSRTSRGGVQRGAGLGNVYKGSYTNAAKLAFARLGPGHEIYLGAADLDPDTDPEAAEQLRGGEPEPAATTGPIGNAIAQKLVDRAFEIPGAKDKLQLAVSHAAGADVGDVSTKAKAKKAIAQLTFPQAEKLDRWITRKTEGTGEKQEADDAPE
jgi:hypothetical protein